MGNALPNDKVLALTKAFVDDKFSAAKTRNLLVTTTHLAYPHKMWQNLPGYNVMSENKQSC